MAEVTENPPLLPGSNFLKGATGMPVVRQATLLIALAASVAMSVFVVVWMQEPDYRPLGSSGSPDETAQIVNALSSRGIEHNIDQRTGTVFVPADQIYNARMVLAEEDVVVGGLQKGYEVFDTPPGFGISQFREHNMHRRSVEGELARSIMQINVVQHARVILATPKSSTFLRDRRKPSASVHVSLKSGRVLSADKVRAIMNLVAGGVPELNPADVVIVDQSGSLLSRGAEDESLMRGERDLALVRTIETQLYDKVANILSPWVGGDRFTAEVNAELDFTRAESTQERYDPDLTALRSEQRVEEQQLGRQNTVGGVPGTLTNEPPEFPLQAVEEDVQANETQRSSSVSSTRNFEVDRTISHTKKQIGQIQRLSVAVVVDHNTAIDPESGEETREPWSEEDLSDLTEAVKSAVGFREERGDTVSVVNRAFYRAPEQIMEAPSFWQEAWFLDLLKQVLGGIAIILVVFGLIRPLFRNLSQAGELVREQQSLAIADMTQLREAALQEAVPGLPTPISLDPDDSSAAKMETVRNLISDDPERVAQVVKQWVSEE